MFHHMASFMMFYDFGSSKMKHMVDSFCVVGYFNICLIIYEWYNWIISYVTVTWMRIL